MITIETGCTKSIVCPIHCIKGIAYDGCDYALLHNNCKAIARLDESKRFIGSKETSHYYTSICFDIKECCYYTCTHEHPSTIYKLNLNLEEIDKISFVSGHDQEPCAISTHPTMPIILLLYPDEIIFLDIYSCIIKNVICLNKEKRVFDIIALHDGFVFSYQFENKTYIEVRCSFCDRPQCYYIPCNYQLNAMILMETCCNERQDEIVYLVQLILSDCDTHEQVSMILQILCSHEQPNPPHPDHITCEGGKNEIIHSIALEEAGIAHILNAEGEKLQKAVASDISIDELLMVNDSVRKTIMQITLLEGQLYSKLESLHCICFDDEKQDE